MAKRAVVDYHTALHLNPADVSSKGLLEDAKKALLASGETLETIEALEVREQFREGCARVIAEGVVPFPLCECTRGAT